MGDPAIKPVLSGLSILILSLLLSRGMERFPSVKVLFTGSENNQTGEMISAPVLADDIGYGLIPTDQLPVKEITQTPWDLITATAWSPEGNLLAVAAGNSLYIYRAEDLTHLFSTYIGALTPAISFSPDGEFLTAGSRDGILRVWKLPVESSSTNNKSLDVELSWVTDAHKKGINTVEYSPDGKWLASGGNDAMTRVWEADSGQLMTEIIGGTFSVSRLDFTPDGKTLLILNGDTVRVRDIDSKRIVGSFKADNTLYSMDIRSNGNILAAGDIHSGVLLWKLSEAFKTGDEDYPDPSVLPQAENRPETASKFPKPMVWDLQFSPDEQWLAAGDGNGDVSIWDVERQALVEKVHAGDRAVTSLAFSPDNLYLAAGSLDGSLRIWDFRQLSGQGTDN